MKRQWVSAFLSVAVLTTGFPWQSGVAKAQSPEMITIIIDGKALVTEQPGILENGRVLVPMRAVLEALGAKVEWVDQTQTVHASNVTHQVQVTIGKTLAWNHAYRYKLDVAPRLINSTTYLPLRFTAEALGAAVYWDAELATVIIFGNQDRSLTDPEITQGMKYLNPLVEVDQQTRKFTLLQAPAGVPLTHAVVRTLKAAMTEMNQNIPANTTATLTYDPIPNGELLLGELGVHIGGPDLVVAEPVYVTEVEVEDEPVPVGPHPTMLANPDSVVRQTTGHHPHGRQRLVLRSHW